LCLSPRLISAFVSVKQLICYTTTKFSLQRDDELQYIYLNMVRLPTLFDGTVRLTGQVSGPDYRRPLHDESESEPTSSMPIDEYAELVSATPTDNSVLTQFSSTPDVVILSHQGKTYELEFPAYSIGKSEVLIRDIKAQARSVLHLPDGTHVELYHKGSHLRDDATACRDYGIKFASVIMCVVDGVPAAPEERVRLALPRYETDEQLRPFEQAGSSADATKSPPQRTISSFETRAHEVAKVPYEDRLFVRPAGFRPNSQFVGRDSELQELHRMLFDKTRRAEGTSAVVVQSLPGGGKTCLVRQYVYKHLDNFPGGVFWLGAKSLSELSSGFWEISMKLGLSSPSMNMQLDDPNQFIEAVKSWLCKHHEWLLVLDGIQFDDTPELYTFIPDSTNSSLIYTSTERFISERHHFLNPKVLRLPLLSARESQQASI
jgi:hypothetical protein